jgi:hypothetical protein
MDIISDKVVKTRKPHMCFGCGRKFEKGTTMNCQVNKHDGEIHAVYSCETCQELMRDHGELFWDECEGFYPLLCVQEYISNTKYFKISPESLLFILTPKSHPDQEQIDEILEGVKKYNLAPEKIGELYSRLSLVIYGNQEEHGYDCWASGVGGGACDFAISIPKGSDIPEYLALLFFDKIDHEFKVECKRSYPQLSPNEDSYNFEIELK